MIVFAQGDAPHAGVACDAVQHRAVGGRKLHGQVVKHGRSGRPQLGPLHGHGHVGRDPDQPRLVPREILAHAPRQLRPESAAGRGSRSCRLCSPGPGPRSFLRACGHRPSVSAFRQRDRAPGAATRCCPGHRLQPDRLPDARTGRVGGTAGVQRLLAAKLPASVGRVPDRDHDFLRAFLLQGLGDVEGKSIEAAAMAAEAPAVDADHGLPVHRAEVQQDPLAAPRAFHSGGSSNVRRYQSRWSGMSGFITPDSADSIG